ncbi:hypothetical protein F4821DRAFT_54361 [Hypoxylon rubiginosum]|uniref:Uncharacterized protein n=1 Tax=Hypoxylon rubiginosum TaxID=110542 RepID=A0ACC0CJQ4_9PEZI|nr:hypothetical protein F4821DRAFT_54361 [Hypoxylon rubiginosum]
MWSRLMRRRAALILRNQSTNARNQIQRRTLISAPKPGDGPLMERRPDRELPTLPLGTHVPPLPRHNRCVQRRHLQLPEAVVSRRRFDAVRPTDESEGARDFGG